MRNDAVQNDTWLLDPLMTEQVARPPILMHDMSIQPRLNETPDIFSRRLYQYTKGAPALCGTTARLLSLHSTPFLCKALDAYMLRFHFQRYPIDIALRYFWRSSTCQPSRSRSIEFSWLLRGGTRHAIQIRRIQILHIFFLLPCCFFILTFMPSTLGLD